MKFVLFLLALTLSFPLKADSLSALIAFVQEKPIPTQAIEAVEVPIQPVAHVSLPAARNTNLTKAQRHLIVALYHEARGEPISGQEQVVQVILNRSNLSGRTVTQEILRPYQFSFVRHHSTAYLDREYERITRTRDFQPLKRVVLRVTSNQAHYGRFRYTHYTRTEIQRSWMRGARNVRVLGNHKFMILRYA